MKVDSQLSVFQILWVEHLKYNMENVGLPLKVLMVILILEAYV